MLDLIRPPPTYNIDDVHSEMGDITHTGMDLDLDLAEDKNCDKTKKFCYRSGTRDLKGFSKVLLSTSGAKNHFGNKVKDKTESCANMSAANKRSKFRRAISKDD